MSTQGTHTEGQPEEQGVKYPYTQEDVVNRLGSDSDFAQKIITAANQTDVGKGFLENYRKSMSADAIKQAEQDAYKKATGEAYGTVDQVVAELLGSEKPEGVKTTDWLKQAFSQKSNATNDEAMQVLKDRLEAAMLESNNIRQKSEATTKEYDAKIRELTVGNSVSVGFSQLSFDAHVNEHLLSTAKNAVMSILVKQAKVDDAGGVVFYGNDGKPILNAQQKAATASEAAKVLLEPMGVLAKPKGGGASPDKITNVDGVSIASAKSKAEALNLLSSHLRANKVAPNTKQWNDAFNALYENKKYQELLD